MNYTVIIVKHNNWHDDQLSWWFSWFMLMKVMMMMNHGFDGESVDDVGVDDGDEW